jgi:hypothetical protein
MTKLTRQELVQKLSEPLDKFPVAQGNFQVEVKERLELISQALVQIIKDIGIK